MEQTTIGYITLGNGTLLVVVVVAAILFVLLGSILFLLLKSNKAQLTTEDARSILRNAENKANAIIAEATAEARSARLKMEEDRTKALGQDMKEVEHFLDAYRFRLDKVIKELAYGVEKEHARVTGQFIESLQHLEERVSENAKQATGSMNYLIDWHMKLKMLKKVFNTSPLPWRKLRQMRQTEMQILYVKKCIK